MGMIGDDGDTPRTPPAAAAAIEATAVPCPSMSVVFCEPPAMSYPGLSRDRSSGTSATPVSSTAIAGVVVGTAIRSA
jgi:hypothetical protein